jgi:hypothetical protein
LRKNFIVAGLLLLILGLTFATSASGRHEVKVQDLTIQKKDPYYVLTSNLLAGEDFSAEFVCQQSRGQLRMVLVTESWYNKWRSGQDVPGNELLGDTYGRTGKIALRVPNEGTFDLVLVPNNATADWPFDVNVRLEGKSERGAGWFMGMTMLVGGIVVTVAGLMKKPSVRGH